MWRCLRVPTRFQLLGPLARSAEHWTATFLSHASPPGGVIAKPPNAARWADRGTHQDGDPRTDFEVTILVWLTDSALLSPNMRRASATHDYGAASGAAARCHHSKANIQRVPASPNRTGTRNAVRGYAAAGIGSSARAHSLRACGLFRLRCFSTVSLRPRVRPATGRPHQLPGLPRLSSFAGARARGFGSTGERSIRPRKCTACGVGSPNAFHRASAFEPSGDFLQVNTECRVRIRLGRNVLFGWLASRRHCACTRVSGFDLPGFFGPRVNADRPLLDQG